MPEYYTWAILIINQQDEIGEKQLSVFGSKGGQNNPLMHVPLFQFCKLLPCVRNIVSFWHQQLHVIFQND